MNRVGTGLVAILAACGGAGHALADNRDVALILSFRTLCTAERPDFAHIDKAATDAGLQLLRAVDTPGPDGMFMRQKIWLVKQQSGQHALMGVEVNGTEGHLIGCGIVSPDMNADGFKPALAASFKLGKPSSERPLPSTPTAGTPTPTAPTLGASGAAGRVTRWENTFGPGTALVLSQGPQGAGLDYQVREPRQR